MDKNMKQVENEHSRWKTLKIGVLGYELSLQLVFYDREYLASKYGRQIQLKTKVTELR